MHAVSKFEVHVKNIIEVGGPYGNLTLTYFQVAYVSGSVADGGDEVTDVTSVTFPSQIIAHLDRADDVCCMTSHTGRTTMVLQAIRDWFGLYPTSDPRDLELDKHPAALTMKNIAEFSEILGTMLKGRTVHLCSVAAIQPNMIATMLRALTNPRFLSTCRPVVVENDYTQIPALLDSKIEFDRKYALVTREREDYTLVVTQAELQGLDQLPAFKNRRIQPAIFAIGERGRVNPSAVIDRVEPEIRRILRMSVLFALDPQNGEFSVISSPFTILGKQYYTAIPGMLDCEIADRCASYRNMRDIARMTTEQIQAGMKQAPGSDAGSTPQAQA